MKWKKFIAGATAAGITLSLIPAAGAASAAETTTRNHSFEESASLLLEKTGTATLGTPNADGGVAEIVSYNSDTREAYVVNGQNGVLDVVTLNADGSLTLKKEIAAKNLIDGFSYGDMTSVAVDTVNQHIVIALQAADYTASGRIAVLNYDGTLVTSYEAGVQPDMVTVSEDGTYILSANEGEPREGYGNGIVDPKGSVTIVNQTTDSVNQAGFGSFDSTELSKQGVLFSKVDGKIADAANDLEPEYITISGNKAYVSLQEANAIATLDLTTSQFTSVKSVGFIDYSDPANSVDLVSDGTYKAATYPNAKGVRMPDGISSFTANGTTYLVTANEGDAREWGDFVNEAKATLTDSEGNKVKKVRVLDQNVTAGLDADTNYLFGGRSFTILNADTMEVVFDSKNDFESKTASYLPDYFNISNDDIEIDSRSAKKGPEPETVIVETIGEKTFAFVALERIGGIMVYDVTNPASATFVNYINTRDFSSDIAGDVAPEGLTFVSAKDSASGSPVLLAACEVSGTLAAYTLSGSDVPKNEKDTIVLYTNDIHAAIDQYSNLAAYSADLESQGYQVVTVDAGDAIQGEAIASLTKGEAVVDLMNAAGYDFAVPGNHEFDYNLSTFLNLTKKAEFQYLSANFVNLQTNTTVLKPYSIVTKADGEEIAFVGISTPETYTKSTPAYFQNSAGKYLYSFMEDAFYITIQNAVDGAIAEGANQVVAIGHLGADGITEGWSSKEVIANTTGIDAFIDGHAHQTIPAMTTPNKDGKEIPLTSTGTKFSSFGKMTLEADGDITTELIDPKTVTAQSDAAKQAHDTVQAKIDAYNSQFDNYLNEKLGTAEVELTVNGADGNRRIRNGETNMGDFVADAYRAITGADIALVNGGGIRASIAAGDVTRKNLTDVNPWSNEMIVIKATGQQIADALEHGARMNPAECGGFLQVSGISYEVQNYKETPVITDEKGLFQSIDSTKERRVTNIKVGGTPIDLTKTYTVTGTSYTLKQQGDGYTMFADSEVVKKDGLPVDAAMLEQYFTETLGGSVSAAQYGNPLGDGRIQVVETEQETETTTEFETTTKKEFSSGQIETTTTTANEQTAADAATTTTASSSTTTAAQTGDNNTPILPFAGMAAALICVGGLLAGKKKEQE